MIETLRRSHRIPQMLAKMLVLQISGEQSNARFARWRSFKAASKLRSGYGTHIPGDITVVTMSCASKITSARQAKPSSTNSDRNKDSRTAILVANSTHAMPANTHIKIFFKSAVLRHISRRSTHKQLGLVDPPCRLSFISRCVRHRVAMALSSRDGRQNDVRPPRWDVSAQEHPWQGKARRNIDALREARLPGTKLLSLCCLIDSQ